VIAVTGPVMQLSFVLYRSPVNLAGCMQDLYRCLYLFMRRRECLNDGLDLAGMYAPHAGITEFMPGTCRISGNHAGIANLGSDIVRRHLAMGMTGGSDFQL